MCFIVNDLLMGKYDLSHFFLNSPATQFSFTLFEAYGFVYMQTHE